MTETRPEIEALETTIAWRLRCLDADPADAASAEAVRRLEALAEDLAGADHAALWTELGALLNWLGESDGVSDYLDLATDYRNRIGVSEHPRDGAAYIGGLLDIARSLI
ncbi:MAG TPA: hypothetical protein VHB27_04775 [Rhodopila sp.]|uniref:hypothetical protein n=1 Tax=Rhodopila sp. TaxID=2480087 RepID=UPI002CCFA873|nr:hypothetical protein [Rhodopila sp.]HVY14517.1 hypothetical protein [Rhodopila sp.]